mmetsp:Transcript_22115/g.58568  ORF Transcript_22115/g.58568 Transcript_22115/m.58568 type:complete len:245 (+) Transcript_22115:2238-2972(+)
MWQRRLLWTRLRCLRCLRLPLLFCLGLGFGLRLGLAFGLGTRVLSLLTSVLSHLPRFSLRPGLGFGLCPGFSLSLGLSLLLCDTQRLSLLGGNAGLPGQCLGSGSLRCTCMRSSELRFPRSILRCLALCLCGLCFQTFSLLLLTLLLLQVLHNILDRVEQGSSTEFLNPVDFCPLCQLCDTGQEGGQIFPVALEAPLSRDEILHGLHQRNLDSQAYPPALQSHDQLSAWERDALGAVESLLHLE